MTNYTVSSGQVFSSALRSSDFLRVLSGGESFTVNIAGVEYVSVGGQSLGDNVVAGGQEVVWGTADFDAILASGSQFVEYGGVDDFGAIYGTQYVYGLGEDETVSGVPAYQYVESGGSALSATLRDVAFQSVESGGTAIATTISDTAEQIVSPGGDAVSTVVLNGGLALIDAGGTGDALTVSAGGFLGGSGVLLHANIVAGTASGLTVGDPHDVDTLELRSGGLASNVTVTFIEDWLQVDAGARATATVVVSGGQDRVFGSTLSTTVSAGGSEYVSSGGTADTAMVLSGGIENIGAGGTAEHLAVSSGGLVDGPGVLIDDDTVGGVASGVSVGDPAGFGTIYVVPGGVAQHVTAVQDGYLEVESGASATGTVLTSGGSALVYGVTWSTTVSAGSKEFVFSKGGSNSATVLSGGTESIGSGASGESLVVSSGGVLDGPGMLVAGNTVAGLVSGVTVGGPAVLNFNRLELVSGGVAQDVTVTIVNDVLQVDAGASASRTILKAGAHDLVLGTAMSTTVSSGSTEFVASPGASSLDPTVLAAGEENVGPGALVSGGVISSGGVLVLSSGATAENVTVSSGGVLEDYLVVSSGATVSVPDSPVTATATVSGVTLEPGALVSVVGATVSAGGVLSGPGPISGLVIVSLAAGASADGLQVLSGATLELAGGSTMSGGTIGSGGAVSGAGILEGVVTDSGRLEGTTVSGALIVASGGTVSGAVLIGGGTLSAGSGAIIDAVQARSGGSAVFASGAVASGLTVLSGGHVSGSGAIYSGSLVILSGGSLSGGTLAAGGTDVDHAGGSEAITIASGATLELVSAVIGAGTTVRAGLETIAQTVSGATLDPGATLELVSVTISSGGTVDVPLHGLILGATVRSGAVLSGPATLEGVSTDSGRMLGVDVAGGLTVASGALLSGGEISTVAGVVSVASGGAASGVGIPAGGTLSGLPGASLGALTVSSGGRATLAAGDTLSGLTVLGGGAAFGAGASYQGPLTVRSGAQIHGGTLTRGIDDLYAGGTEAITLATGTTLDLISAVVGPGTVRAGLLAAAATISGVYLPSGAEVEFTTVTVSSGGALDVLPTGRVLGAHVLASGSLVDNGGVTDSAGGIIAGILTGSGTLEESGAGMLIVSSGAAFTGKILIEAGEVQLAGAGGVGSAKIEFVTPTSPASLVIDATDAPAPGSTWSSEILDFSNANDSIHLASLAFVAGATATVSGATLMLADGGKTYDFSLGGTIAPSYVATKDGTGTLITADPPAAASAGRLVQAMATFGTADGGGGPATGPSLVLSGFGCIGAPIAAHAAHAALAARV